ncbi:MAG: hypothetical protein ACRDHL_06980 [Candidatus Promineifilaceae bacterium]
MLAKTRFARRPDRARLRPGAWLLLGCLVALALRPPPILVTPGPDQDVHSLHPILGVHTRLTDEVELWKIERSLELTREMGAGTIVEFFPWAYYEPAPGRFAWEHPDAVIEHAAAQGLTVIARLGLTPDWARPADTPLSYLDAGAFDDFADFAAAFAARYADRLPAIIIGNEPNLSFEWGYRQASAEEYVALLRAVYPAVKRANPAMRVLGGALAPNLEPGGSPWAINDLVYLDQLYRLGAAEYFDVLAVHVYGLTFPPQAAPGPEVLNFRRVELMREVMLAHGDGETPILITETGWNDHPRWTRAVRPAQRIRYTLDAVRYAEANWPYVELVALWALRYPAPSHSYADYFTLITPEFVAKPIYDELKRFTGN